MSLESLDDILSLGSIVEPGNRKLVPSAPAVKNTPSPEKDKPSFLARAGKKLEDLLKPREERQARGASLEDRANSSGLQKYSPGSVLNSASQNNEKEGGEKFSLKKMAWDIAKYSPVLALQTAIFPAAAVKATMIPAVGLALGSILENRKKGKPTTWSGLKKEFYTGNNLGFMDYYAFSLPEIVMNLAPGLWPAPALAFHLSDLPMQILRTAMFESLVLPYNVGYHTFTYFRDKVGLGKTIGGLMTGKIFKYLKDSWTEQTKPNVWSDTKSVWKYLAPLHHFQINHLTSPELRMLQSVLVNTPIYRYLMRDKSDEKKESMTLEYNPKSKLYTPEQSLGYAGTPYQKDKKSRLHLPRNLGGTDSVSPPIVPSDDRTTYRSAA